MRSRNLVLAWENRLSVATRSPTSQLGDERAYTWERGQGAWLTTPTSPVSTFALNATWPSPQVFDLVAMPWHGLPAGTTISCTFRLGGAQGQIVHQTLVSPAWPAMPWGSVPFGEPGWWGHVTPGTLFGEWEGFWRLLLPNSVVADRLELSLSVPHRLSPIPIPLIFAGPAVQVATNYEYGAVEGWAGGEAEGVDDGAPIGAEVELPPRTLRVRLPKLTDHEALLGLSRLVQACGRGRRPFIAMPDPGESFDQARRSMVAFFRRLPDLELVRRGTRAVTLDLVEWRI